MRAPTRFLLMSLLLVPVPAAAQGLLDQFSYEGLRVAGLGVDLGATFSNRLERRVSASLRVDGGWIAPNVPP